jgi:hypothetical protein
MNNKILHKGDSLTFTFQGYFDIILGWESDDDLDLCIFYVTVDDKVGGVFSRFYNHSKNSEGTLNQFPFIALLGETHWDSKRSEDIIRVKDVGCFDKIYIVAIDYANTINGEDLFSFNTPIMLELDHTLPTISLEINKDEFECGTICLISELKVDGDKIIINNKSTFCPMDEAFVVIPGFESIINVNF